MTSKRARQNQASSLKGQMYQLKYVISWLASLVGGRPGGECLVVEAAALGDLPDAPGALPKRAEEMGTSGRCPMPTKCCASSSALLFPRWPLQMHGHNTGGGEMLPHNTRALQPVRAHTARAPDVPSQLFTRRFIVSCCHPNPTAHAAQGAGAAWPRAAPALLVGLKPNHAQEVPLARPTLHSRMLLTCKIGSLARKQSLRPGKLY